MNSVGPRLVVAGTHSGVGKTTIATGLMAALRQAGHIVASAKVGPDFIDPGYHALATGRHPRNLDPWICGADAIAPLAARASEGADILVIEGVMGLFDGAVDGSLSSTADVARLLSAPVVLVVDAASMSSSVAALVRGYRDHDPSIHLAGVILNQVGSDLHIDLLTEALASIDVTVLGAVRRDEDLVWRDRHLGLVPVEEHNDEVVDDVQRLGRIITDSCDLELLMSLALKAPALHTPAVRSAEHVASVRVGVATGKAFGFMYRDNLEALRAAGAELSFFDPLVCSSLPENIDGLVLGGGFPEVFVERLGQNTELMADVRERIEAGLVTWAECGGLLWLGSALDGRSMAGVVEATGAMTKRLSLGYRSATIEVSNPLGEVGTVLRGHEFHYSRLEPGGDALELTSRYGVRKEGFATPTLLATYLHQHLGGDPSPAETFVRTCDRYRAIRSEL